MPEPQDVIAKLKGIRVRYLEEIVNWRAARDEADTKLRAAEQEMAQVLAQLFREVKA